MDEEPRERFRRWVGEVGGNAAAARLIGCHRSYIVHLLAPKSERRPGLDVAFAIECASAGSAVGQIRAEEWVATPDHDSPRARLRLWVEEAGGKQAAAEAIGCDSSYLWHLLRDPSRRPGIDVAFAIERATTGSSAGQIRAEEWADPPADRRATGTDGA